MVSFCRNGMTGRHGCAGLAHPLRCRYRQAVHFAGRPACGPYGIAMGRWNFVRFAGSPAWSPYGIAMDHWISAVPLCTLPSALFFSVQPHHGGIQVFHAPALFLFIAKNLPCQHRSRFCHGLFKELTQMGVCPWATLSAADEWACLGHGCAGLDSPLRILNKNRDK